MLQTQALQLLGDKMRLEHNFNVRGALGTLSIVLVTVRTEPRGLTYR